MAVKQIFGCPLEVFKRRALMRHIYAIPMYWLIILGRLEILTAKYICKCFPEKIDL
jgi:hypothetical protein